VTIQPARSTTASTPAVLTVAHPSWCAVSECPPTPDWGTDGMGFVAHYARLLDVDGLLVEVAQGETASPQGGVVERNPDRADHGRRDVTATTLVCALPVVAALTTGYLVGRRRQPPRHRRPSSWTWPPRRRR
jgi:hypothetical protein